MKLMYLSFADDSGFLGCCVVEAGDIAEAAHMAWLLGINPGGEVLGCPVPEGEENTLPHNRLLTKADLEATGGAVRYGDVSEEASPFVDGLHEDCNAKIRRAN